MWPFLLIGGVVALMLASKGNAAPAQPEAPPTPPKPPRKRLPDETPFGGFEDPRRYRALAKAAVKAGQRERAAGYNKRADSLNAAIRKARAGQPQVPASIKR